MTNIIHDSLYEENGVKHVTKEIKVRLRDDNDVVIAMTGYEGKGKSTLAILMALGIDPHFDLENNIIWTTKYKNIRETINNKIKRYGCSIFDEAIKQFDKKNWSDNVQQALIRYFTTFRKQNKCHIVCIPSFDDLTKTFRQRRIYIWIHIIDRGVAVLMKSMDKSPTRAWFTDDIDKMFKKGVEKRKMNPWSTEDIISLMSKSPHFVCIFPFPQLDPEIENKYLELCRVHADKDIMGEDAEDDVNRFNVMRMRFGHLLYNVRKNVYAEKRARSWTGLGESIETSRTTLRDIVDYFVNVKRRQGVRGLSTMDAPYDKTSDKPKLLPIHIEEQKSNFVDSSNEESDSIEKAEVDSNAQD